MLFRAVPLYFANHAEKAAYMQRSAERDALHPFIHLWAEQFRRIPGEWERSEAILRFCQLCIDYTNDPGVEILDSSIAALLRGFGDCDAKTRVFVALCLACGLPAETLPVFRDHGRRFPHVLAKVYLSGAWRRADPTIVNSRIDAIPRRGIITNYWGTK